ncbi:hypothetical protein Lfu02_27170 [Longispora fulva]|uniref:Uncharacterized protein n=1 Tax=Longispora fulva TaxID=619741 RepID=A0A8J7KRT3_9ACTN|nr:DUF6113 family protein [Longispora fulva]MBG6138852.1 hypothetical protein [Longispora fulva]GIG58345.1 hypothetical protein Lfu02_27170 [Longispora fulva]
MSVPEHVPGLSERSFWSTALEVLRPLWRPFHDTVVVIVACWMAVVTSTAEAFFTPFRLFGVLLPVSAVAALVVTPFLSTVTHRVTGLRRMSMIPAVLWLLVAVYWSTTPREGDHVITGSWTGLVYLIAGSAAAAYGAYKVVMPPLPPRPVERYPVDGV